MLRPYRREERLERTITDHLMIHDKYLQLKPDEPSIQVIITLTTQNKTPNEAPNNLAARALRAGPQSP